MSRIKIVLAAASLLAVSATSARAQSTPPVGNHPGAFESLKAYTLLASIDRGGTASPPIPLPVRESWGGLSGEQLFQELHKALMSVRAAPPGYKQAKAYMYSKADNVICGGGPGIMTFYSEVCVRGSSDNGGDYPEQGDQNEDGVVDSFVNAEHIWPQSYFKSAMPMVSDLHQLAPTLYTPNSRRGNVRFAEVSNASYSTSCGSKLGREGFEPCDPEKGNVARAMLYFVARYYDKNIRQGMNYKDFWTSRVPLLLKWNRQDPPDTNELRRNDLVEAFQGNRNPFIDDPSLADRIGEAVLEAH